MGSSARDVVQSLGDALAGVDRNQSYLKGQEIGATVDEKRAQTEAAMANARHLRIQAEVEEAKKQRDDQIAAADAATLEDPNTMPIGTIVAAGRGGDYASAMEGRLKGQTFNQRQTVGTPAPIGDDVAEAARQAAEDALAPTAAVVSRRPAKPPAPGAPQVVTDPDDPNQTILIPGTGGPPLQVQTPTGPKTARPGAKPGTAPGPTGHMRDIEYLVAHGWKDTDAQQFVMGPKASPEALYNAVVNAELRNFAKPEDAAKLAKQMVATRFGADAAEQASMPRGPDPEAEGLPTGVPKGSKLIGHTKDGGEVYQLPDGSKVVAE